MPKLKSKTEPRASNRIELHFTDAQNKKIVSKVKAHNKKSGTELTRKEYLQNLVNIDANKK